MEIFPIVFQTWIVPKGLPLFCINCRPECSYRAMWDLQDPANRKRESLCDLILDVLNGRRVGTLSPFKIVYSARSYIIFELLE